MVNDKLFKIELSEKDLKTVINYLSFTPIRTRDQKEEIQNLIGKLLTVLNDNDNK